MFSMSRVSSQSLVGAEEKGHGAQVDTGVGRRNVIAIVRIKINM